MTPEREAALIALIVILVSFALGALSVILFSTCVASATTEVELKQFLAEDKTDENQYMPGSYMCGHFSEDLIRNASRQDITMYPVVLYARIGRNHMIVACITEDGLYFVEPQCDECLDYNIFLSVYSNSYRAYRIGLYIEHSCNNVSGSYAHGYPLDIQMFGGSF